MHYCDESTLFMSCLFQRFPFIRLHTYIIYFTIAYKFTLAPYQILMSPTLNRPILITHPFAKYNYRQYFWLCGINLITKMCLVACVRHYMY